MSRSHSGQPSLSNGDPSRPSEIGLQSSRELEFILEDPPSRKETTARAGPSEELPHQFVSLVRDLSCDDGQLKRRRQEGLDGPRKVWEKLAKLKMIDLTRNPYQRLTLEPWHELVIIAATRVDRHLGNNETAASTVLQLNGRVLARDTVTRDQRVVQDVIQLADHLYLHWKHDFALELPLLMNCPISFLRQQSTQKFAQLKLLLQEQKPSPKIKSSLKLYLPFLVRLLRPEYGLSDIQKALKTSVFNQTDWDTFRKALDGPAPEYDPIRDAWTAGGPSNGLELSEFIDYGKNYPAKVHIPIFGFKAFETSPDLQRKVAYASENQTGHIPTSPDMFAYDWAEDIHGPVKEQVLRDLAKSGFIQADDVYIKKVSVSHGLTSTTVPTGRLQIIVPLEDSPCTVSLSGQGSSTTVKWNTETAYMLAQEMTLSASGWIKYISLLATT
ncbi:unnamed protein product [Fusarium fujikuroi]|uniref:Uncharacterized protein n=1 Tax=Fusarium fujikuroi TaxID=5127 RepID=A0A9Q9RRM4_FUSFU|nr:uncharacterized protein FFE2_04887 [Fusarium fujikuroi]SCV35369.1 uncharacterized protein FFFS_04703 [Fusarium fujikuroi]VTT63510.1 unnamed protein product [Fusarium fujikuroi]VTT73811.1 unnamed protein product [Fusarium fujikuroi]VZI04249.1 unnamed protein product [Fusarium fujikuroi]